MKRLWRYWLDAAFPKVWAVTEDLGSAGFLVVSAHRSSSSATLSIPDGRGTYAVMHVDMVEHMNSERSHRSLAFLDEAAPENGDQEWQALMRELSRRSGRSRRWLL